jgi:hypothetical protein
LPKIDGIDKSQSFAIRPTLSSVVCGARAIDVIQPPVQVDESLTNLDNKATG